MYVLLQFYFVDCRRVIQHVLRHFLGYTQVRLLRIRLKELLVACDARPDKWMTYLRRLCDHFARHNTVVPTDTAAARRGGTTLGSTGSAGATLDINAFYHLVTYLKVQVNEEGLRRLFASVALLDDCRLVS